MRGKRKRITILMVAAMLGILAGCTPDSSKDSTKEVQKTEAEQETERNEKPEEGQEPEDERKEVSREDFPDCDGSGHGYIEIHYSDGSTEIEEY